MSECQKNVTINYYIFAFNMNGLIKSFEENYDI